MKTTAVSLPRLTLPSSSGLTARLGDFVTLMKPRVMLLAVFTALVGLLIAPRHLDPLHAAIAIMAIAAGGGAAGVLNMWYEADIDAAMTRTAKRPIPRGKISRAEALPIRYSTCGRRGRYPWLRAQCRRGSAACLCDRFLRRRVHDVA
jgi:protoheme IX farnesyltransferase